MNKKFLDALESCLKRMEHGEPLDSILTRYPDLAAQLHPLLETAARARSARRESVPLTILARQRSRLLALAGDLRQGKDPKQLQRRSWRTAVTILAVLALLVISSNGLLIASAHSIPGDTLYPLKRSVESTQLHLVSNLVERDELEHTFDERRVEETRHLINDQRVISVEFTGIVSNQSENEWLVSGIPVVVTARTDVEPGIAVGDVIKVEGATNAAGGVDAIRLSLERDSATEDGDPGVAPAHTPSPDEGNLEVSPTLTASLDGSLEPGDGETATESSVTPAHSGEGGNQTSEGNDQSSPTSHEDHSSDEINHTPQTDSGSKVD